MFFKVNNHTLFFNQPRVVPHDKSSTARPLRFTLRKEEVLRSSKNMQRVFQQGRVVTVGVIRCHYYCFKAEQLQSKIPRIRIGFSVPQRLVKHAVQRNRLKRLLRESYRLNKHMLDSKVIESNICIDLVLVFHGGVKVDDRRLTLQNIVRDVIRCFEVLRERLEEKMNS